MGPALLRPTEIGKLTNDECPAWLVARCSLEHLECFQARWLALCLEAWQFEFLRYKAGGPASTKSQAQLCPGLSFTGDLREQIFGAALAATWIR